MLTADKRKLTGFAGISAYLPRGEQRLNRFAPFAKLYPRSLKGEKRRYLQNQGEKCQKIAVFQLMCCGSASRAK